MPRLFPVAQHAGHAPEVLLGVLHIEKFLVPCRDILHTNGVNELEGSVEMRYPTSGRRRIPVDTSKRKTIKIQNETQSIHIKCLQA